MDKIDFYHRIIEVIRNHTTISPVISIILGSGLGRITELVDNKVEISYSQLPGFPKVTVPGHEGKLVLGFIATKPVLVFKGRLHYYEGWSGKEIAIFPRLSAILGVRVLIVTNAAGGIGAKFNPGDLALIRDHINLSGFNPLRGYGGEEWGPRFVDMSEPYDRELRELAKNVAQQLRLELQEGVYVMMQGPSYETPSEIRMLKTIGADFVGMSTVPEVIIAKQLGLKVIAFSCITNKASGEPGAVLDHEDVQKVANSAGKKLEKLILHFIQRIEPEKYIPFKFREEKGRGEVEIPWDKLLKEAEEVLKKAYAPYSNYRVGAALLCKNGKIYTGCNVENASYGDTICAERVAVVKAVSEGEREFKAIVVVTEGERFAFPCGSCRQVLSEFNPELPVMVATTVGMRRLTNLRELLPESFRGEFLKKGV